MLGAVGVVTRWPANDWATSAPRKSVPKKSERPFSKANRLSAEKRVIAGSSLGDPDEDEGQDRARDQQPV